MLLYELLYCFKVLALLCALLSADPEPVEYIVVYSLLLTFLVLFFCSHSHQQRTADQTDHTISMIVFSMLSTLVSFFDFCCAVLVGWVSNKANLWPLACCGRPDVGNLAHDHAGRHTCRHSHPTENFHFLHVLSVICAAPYTEPKQLVL